MAKRHSPKFKFQVVMEVISEDRSIVEVGRTYKIHPNTIQNWIRRFKDNGSKVFSQDGETNELEKKVAQLERLLGQKEREIALLKNFLGSVD
jgi:transposase